ncbi:MAG: acyl-CoA dehydrogenase domain-containing protein [Candidatus Magnetoglobus multicellularis str. Araruama]|uniref:Acyl-CoA dehydrogenase domain-containing protein n=1 Tax=Candidatus Magnetoglobus multicellularis str. Araruama TaxID=890399 RepID=A0A1V1P998_9BACT|nr:MAG: acyl-CoA dehydrogenase domain-containing protein [Candidatus Magnetoglobus multicellularis str. Araruama]
MKPMSMALEMLGRISSSDHVNRWKLREPALNLVYQGLRQSVRVGKLVQSRYLAPRPLHHDETLKKNNPLKNDRFDLTLTREQQMVRDELLKFAKQVIRPMSRDVDSGDVRSEFFSQVNELGLAISGVPEAIKGAGTLRSPVSNMLMAEDLAYGDMSLAIAALAPLGFVNTMTEFGSREQQARYLPPFTGEEFVYASLALMEPEARFNVNKLKTLAVPTNAGFRLNGVKCLVPLGTQSKLIIVFAELADHGPRGFILERHYPGITIEKELNMGLSAAGMSRMRMTDVEVPAFAVLGEQEVHYSHQRMVDLARIGICGLSLGTCQAALDFVIKYANERIAFGEPISNRQAVAFMIADMAIELESMRMLTYRAAGRAEQGLPFHRETYLAQLMCAQRAMQIGTDAVQILGGHGFVCEYPVELWYRQLRAVGILEGTFVV